MKSASDVIACVSDHSIFLPIALKLSEQFKHVYYFSPWEEAYPTLKKGIVGDGFDNLERVDNIWDVKKDCDLFVFPDIGFSCEQKELISQGYPVWGARDADSFEVNRGQFLKAIEAIGLPVPKYKIVKGLTNLREHLRDRTDKWIKVSKWRGDWETLHWRDWAHDETTLDYYAFTLGPLKDHIIFYVFDTIETDIEDGMDTYVIGGKMPSICLHGMEQKDKAFLCAVADMKDIPEQVRGVTEAFVEMLVAKGYDYRSFFSSEVRIAGDKSYFIDPTMRAGSPPSQVMTELFSNLGEIIWHGANGELIDPEPTAQFGAQILLKAKGHTSAWSVVEIPPEIRQWIKCSNVGEVDGKLVSPPGERGSNDIGWLCAIGDTIKDTISTLQDHASKLPDGIECDPTELAHLLEEIHEAEDNGMPFTDQEVPSPESILAEP